MSEELRLGLSTFGDITARPDGAAYSQAEVIRQIVEQGVLADEVGATSFSLGEHHRPDFAVSSPDSVLSAIAALTSQVRLGTAVTVLSSDDPVRVYERFATLDALSAGRAEITLGRGSFTESFPLFGYSLKDYEVLFDEKLDLFAALLEEQPVTWSGVTRGPLNDAEAYPKTTAGIEAWVGVGGTPASVTRAARYGMNLMLAIIGGAPSRFQPLVYQYHRDLALMGKPDGLVGAYSAGYVAETDEQAMEDSFEGFSRSARRIGGERGWRAFTKEGFIRECGPEGSTYVGSPESVALKIVNAVKTLRLDRFDLNYATASDSPQKLLRSIELYGTQVIPLVRDMLA